MALRLVSSEIFNRAPEVALDANPLTEILRHGADRSDRSRAALVLSVAFHTAIAGALVFTSYQMVVPPARRTIKIWVPPSIAPPLPPRAPEVARARPVDPKPPVRNAAPLKLVAPPEIPRNVPTAEEFQRAPSDGSSWDGDARFGERVIGGSDEGVDVLPDPVSVVPPIVVTTISEAKLLKRVEPDYPRVARAAGISGTVVLEAIIGVDGRVEDLTVKESVPMLDRAASDAVKQWLFEPAVRDGQKVRMRLKVSIRFKID